MLHFRPNDGSSHIALGERSRRDGRGYTADDADFSLCEFIDAGLLSRAFWRPCQSPEALPLPPSLAIS
jgi:hypothetical protein